MLKYINYTENALSTSVRTRNGPCVFTTLTNHSLSHKAMSFRSCTLHVSMRNLLIYWILC